MYLNVRATSRSAPGPVRGVGALVSNDLASEGAVARPTPVFIPPSSDTAFPVYVPGLVGPTYSGSGVTYDGGLTWLPANSPPPPSVVRATTPYYRNAPQVGSEIAGLVAPAPFATGPSGGAEMPAAPVQAVLTAAQPIAPGTFDFLTTPIGFGGISLPLWGLAAGALAVYMLGGHK